MFLKFEYLKEFNNIHKSNYLNDSDFFLNYLSFISAAGFYQEALDHVARQGYGNASFEVGGDEGLDIVEEFYSDQQNAVEVQPDSVSSANATQILDNTVQIQHGLRQSVKAIS